MKKLNDNGIGLIVPILIVLIFVLVGAVGWLVYDRQKSENNNQTNTSTSEDSKISENEESSSSDNQGLKIPDDWVKYEDSENKVSFMLPSSWRKSSCDGSDVYFFLIERQEVKCATEDSPDGPAVIFTSEKEYYSNCNNTSEGLTDMVCETKKLGDNEVYIRTSTWQKEGYFGEPKGLVYREYIFNNSQGKTLVITIRANPDNLDILNDIDLLTGTVKFG